MHAPRHLSEEIALLAARSAARALTLREVIFTLRGRAYLLLVILLTLPFLTPIPLPGLSTPFGLAIAAMNADAAKSVWHAARGEHAAAAQA